MSANSTVYNTSNVKQEVIDKQYGNENASTPQTAQIKSNANVKSTGAKKTAANAAAAHATNNGAQKKPDDATTVSQDNSGGETKEVTSRRGRVIKQKRFMDGDDEDSGTGAGAPPKKKAMTLAPAKAKEAATPAATKKLNPFGMWGNYAQIKSHPQNSLFALFCRKNRR